jgi:hypothetical protein
MQPQQLPIQATAPTNRKPLSTSAITGLILSIISFLLIMTVVAEWIAPFFTFFGFLGSAASLVFSIVGAVSCRATGVRRGTAIAITGIVLSLFDSFLVLMVITIGLA